MLRVELPAGLMKQGGPVGSWKLLFVALCLSLHNDGWKRQLGSNWTARQRRFANTKLGCAGSGLEVGFVNECTLLHCFVNASILAKPMDLIWKRDFVKEFRRPCKSVKRCSGAVFSSELLRPPKKLSTIPNPNYPTTR
jgi:hypothetical protein